jgi:hypothetical protein
MPEELDDSQWWLDDNVWLDLFNPAFHEDSSKADRAAKLWHRLLAEIESGPQGATRVAWCLENALRLTFPFTDTFRACRVLFEVSLGESFPPNLDTMALLTEAMKRTRTALQRASRSQPKERRKRSRRK